MRPRTQAEAARERGAWFGLQVGGSLWLLVGGALLLTPAPAVGGVFLGLFAAVTGAGLMLWLQRRQRAPRRSFLVLIAVMAIAALLALAAADVAGHLDTLWQFSGVPSGGPGRATYLILFIYPLLAVRIAWVWRDRPPGV